MRLSQIRDFLAVVETGSLRAAARQLRLSQPALTKSIRQLEQELGALLITRSVRGVQPTEQGRAFLVRARAVHSGLRRAREEIAQMNGEREGSVAVGSAPGPALSVLPQAIVRLRERWPEAAIRIVDISPSDVLPALRDGSLDLALSVRIGPLADPGRDCMVEPLYQNPTAIIARRGHPLAGARRLAQLSEAEWVRTGSPGTPSTLPALFRAAGLPPPRYRVDCNSFLALAELVAGSSLLAVVPWQIAAREAKVGRIVQLAIREAPPAREICIFRRADLPPTPIARDLVDVLRGTARAAP